MTINLNAFLASSATAPFKDDPTVVWASTDGGHGAGSSAGSLANEGIGNGADAPPPGQSYNFNDGAGTATGSPGALGGHGYVPAALIGVDVPPGQV